MQSQCYESLFSGRKLLHKHGFHYYASLISWANPWKTSATLLTLLLSPHTDTAFISVVVHATNILLWFPHSIMFAGGGRPMAFHYFLTFSGICSWEKGFLLKYLFSQGCQLTILSCGQCLWKSICKFNSMKPDSSLSYSDLLSS